MEARAPGWIGLLAYWMRLFGFGTPWTLVRFAKKTWDANWAASFQ